MWHEDILAWQTTRETFPVKGGVFPGAFQLVGQNPQRVYLLITRSDLDGAWISLTQPTGPNQGRFIGRPDLTDLESLSTFSTTGTNDPSGNTFAATTTFAGFQARGSMNGIKALEYLWPRDGLLCKLGWWVWDSAPLCPWYVLEVLMENRPCPSWRVSNGHNGSRMRLQGGRQPVRRGGNVLDPLTWPECAPPGADILPDES